MPQLLIIRTKRQLLIKVTLAPHSVEMHSNTREHRLASRNINFKLILSSHLNIPVLGQSVLELPILDQVPSLTINLCLRAKSMYIPIDIVAYLAD